MPTYDLRNKKTGEITEVQMTISDKEAYLKKNKHLEQVLGMPQIVSGTDGLRKPDDSFRDILREVDKKHKGGRKGNNMNKHSDF